MYERKKLVYLSVFVILFSIGLMLTIKLLPIYKVIMFFITKLILPFVIAAFISYLLYPIVVKLRTYNISETLSVVLLFILFFGIISVSIYFSFPILIAQLEELSEQLPEIIIKYEEIIYSIYESTSFLPESVHDKLDEFIVKMEAKVDGYITFILMKVASIFDVVIMLTVIPVLIFYFLKDYNKIRKSLFMKLPQKYHDKVRLTLRAMDVSLGSYVRGQLLICIVIIVITVTVYDLLQLKYGFVLAVFMGLMNVIPYFGPIIGTIPALIVAMTISWKTVVIVLIITLVIQILEGSILSPYIMGKSVQLHPIMIIFVLFIGAEIGGIIGMVIAIPFVTIIRTIIRELFHNSTNRIDI